MNVLKITYNIPIVLNVLKLLLGRSIRKLKKSIVILIIIIIKVVLLLPSIVLTLHLYY